LMILCELRQPSMRARRERHWLGMSLRHDASLSLIAAAYRCAIVRAGRRVFPWYPSGPCAVSLTAA
jgi:hypothetical protein